MPELINGKGIVCHQDISRRHSSLVTRQKLLMPEWDVMPHPPYSPDLAPSDYYLFRSLQNFLDVVQNPLLSLAHADTLERQTNLAPCLRVHLSECSELAKNGHQRDHPSRQLGDQKGRQIGSITKTSPSPH
ncbi:putative DD34D transposase [Trichonephila clavipes]|nr:putative DD34D transposase [Trichonephila clavipes]